MNLPLAPLAAAILGIAAALGVLAMPMMVLEALVVDSGIASVMPAAEPPLGLTARIMLAGGAAGIAALLGWFMAFILVGTRGLTIGEADDREPTEVPNLRRADAHPDAPPRPPLLATRDLGTPFLDVRAHGEGEGDASGLPVLELESDRALVPVPELETEKLEHQLHTLPSERPLPADFDQPLAAFDPQAIPETPRPKPVPLAPLRPAPRPAVFDDSERFEVFELTPPVRRPVPTLVRDEPRPEAIARPATDASVHALLERLERGVIRRGMATHMEKETRPRDAERGLEEALVTLRNLARSA